MVTAVRRLVFGFGLLIFFVPAAFAANIDSSQKFAWGENIGWLTFEQVTVSSSGLTGYAWGENTGWLSLDCNNTSSCGTVSYGVQNSGGTLSGYAWGENTGWVSFNCSNSSSCGTVNYGVSIDTGTGRFSGYAWGENIGWIVFNCATTNSCATVDYRVTTSFYSSAGSSSGSSGGGANPVFFIRPSETGQVLINDGASIAVSPVVSLKLVAASNVRRMAVSNFADFRDTIQESYQPTKVWQLLPLTATEIPDYQKTGVIRTIYVRYFTEQGQSSPLITASIRLAAKIVKMEPESLPVSPAAKITPAAPGKTIPSAGGSPPSSISVPPLPPLSLRSRPTAPPIAVGPEPVTFKSVGKANFIPASTSPAMIQALKIRSLWFFNIIGLSVLALLLFLLH